MYLKNKANNTYQGIWRGASVAFMTFFIGVFLALPSQQVVMRFSLFLAFPVLFLIILASVGADIIGVAATAAEEAPFHAMASKRKVGAPEAIRIVRHGDRVNSLFADVIGDIAGTLAGAAGTAIVFRLREVLPDLGVTASVLFLAGVAALMVGGKAATKGFALREANQIVYLVGRGLHYFERVIPISLLPGRKNASSRRPRR